MKLNLGCGSQTADGWINVDYAVGARLAKIPFFTKLNKRIHIFDLEWDPRIYIHNLTRKFPWTDRSADIIYTSHILEHFTQKDGFAFLRECHRILKQGGTLRIVVPDLAHVVRAYAEHEIRADEFVERLGVLHSRSNASPIKNLLAPFIRFPHKCMYDTSTLLTILRGIGFDAHSRNPFDSRIREIEEIEKKHRTENAVIVEGQKL